METINKEDVGIKKQSFEHFIKQGESLYGKDKKKWKFKCVNCGNIQSYETVTERNPDIDKKGVSDWIFFACEGRHTKNVGCDWSLGGLFRIHKKEVTNEDGKVIPAFLLQMRVSHKEKRIKS